MSYVYITVLSIHFPPTVEICLCQLFPFLSLLHIYRVLSPILFILPWYCLLVHFDNKMPLRHLSKCSSWPLSPLYAHWFPPDSAVSGPVYFLWWKQLLVTVISQSTGYVRDLQPLLLLSILGAEALSDSHSIPGSHDIISMVFWNYTQWSCFFLSDFIEEICDFFQGWWYQVCSTCL